MNAPVTKINMVVGDVPPITVLLNWKPRN